MGDDVMMITEITQEIKNLPRIEKLHLIEKISKMLRDEESPAKYFTPGAEYPVYTPYGQEKAAAELQRFLEQHKS